MVSSGRCRGVIPASIPQMPDCLSPSSPLKLCLPSSTGSLCPSHPEDSNSRLSCSCSLDTSLELFLTAAPAENKQCSAICGRSHRSARRRNSSRYGAGNGRGPKRPCLPSSSRGGRVCAGGRQSITGEGEPACHAGENTAVKSIPSAKGSQQSAQHLEGTGGLHPDWVQVWEKQLVPTGTGEGGRGVQTWGLEALGKSCFSLLQPSRYFLKLVKGAHTLDSRHCSERRGKQYQRDPFSQARETHVNNGVIQLPKHPRAARRNSFLRMFFTHWSIYILQDPERHTPFLPTPSTVTMERRQVKDTAVWPAKLL